MQKTKKKEKEENTPLRSEKKEKQPNSRLYLDLEKKWRKIKKENEEESEGKLVRTNKKRIRREM